ncbi:MFS general substrate transporter [Rhizodiscina lignyota]|uniref:MFS general substrate transporter n=1 Tax=Rhizodiscina lignyota TaxID=1504668 RepID=A0A9P4I3U4_9PEZI|nr:MFS general substrate transporter [Rhizodiscina lignyota]
MGEIENKAAEVQAGHTKKDEKDGTDISIAEEDGHHVLPDTSKRYYSRLSVWLMILFSGLAIGSDGYNAAVIGNIELILAVLYPNSLTNAIYNHLSNAFLIGMIIGMLGFGVVADQLGRKTGAVATTILLVLGIILSTAASGTDDTGMFWMLIIARGIAGIGAGGEYPVSGAGAIEATDENAKVRKYRGFMVSLVSGFAADLGYVWGGLVPLLLLLCTRQEVSKYGIVWRTSLALGLVPPISIFWFRWKMTVSTAFRKSAMRKQRVPYWLAIKRYWRALLGCSLSWFLYNYISVPFGIFAATITSRVNASDSLVKTLGWGVLINCFYVPGSPIGGYICDKIGRRKTMALGFGLQAILGFILGGAYLPIQNVFPLFIVMYGIFLMLGEVGPGATVILTASECFPTSIRGQMMGFVSAWSKAGAAIGTQVFTAITTSIPDEEKANQTAFLVGSAFAVIGTCSALFIIPDVHRRLDDEDAAWKAYLAEHGWEADWGDEVSKDPKGIMMDGVVS